ncbi:3054_t:CDS:2, partial [Paraglomus brasilianum]
TRALLGAASKTKNGEKPPPVALTEKEKRKQRNIRHGVIGVTTGVLLGGMYWIGGRFGRDQFRIPQRVQYLQLYGRVLPASWPIMAMMTMMMSAPYKSLRTRKRCIMRYGYNLGYNGVTNWHRRNGLAS